MSLRPVYPSARLSARQRVWPRSVNRETLHQLFAVHTFRSTDRACRGNWASEVTSRLSNRKRQAALYRLGCKDVFLPHINDRTGLMLIRMVKAERKRAEKKEWNGIQGTTALLKKEKANEFLSY